MKKPAAQPPPLPRKLLEWFCPPNLVEGIDGDLEEAFYSDLENGRPWKAKVKYTWRVLTFLHPEILLRNKIQVNSIGIHMLSNYIKTAQRNILKRKTYSFINAFGLSIGIAFCVLIYLFVQDERSFDQFHLNKSSIFRIEEKSYDTWQTDSLNPYRRSAWVQAALAPILKSEVTEVKFATRFNNDNSATFRYGDKIFSESGIAYVDADFFQMFSFPLKAGNAATIFKDKKEVVLTTQLAIKYFGDEDPIGKTLNIGSSGKEIFTVTGVIEPPPANSSLSFQALMPQENRQFYEYNKDNWGNFNTPTFVQLHSVDQEKSFEASLDKIIDKYLSPHLKRWKEQATKPIPDDVVMMKYTLTPLSDVHLSHEISWDKVSNPKYSFILATIALCILIIACINYISLALTTSASRKTEVGVRKVVGAGRSQLVMQFGLESLVLVMISLFFGLGLAYIFLPYFNSFTGKEISIQQLDLIRLVSVSLGLVIVVGILAGSYPSLFLSKFNPTQVLKGRFTSRVSAGFTRPLVVVQFVFSAFLMISAVIMFRQMQYITNKDLGYKGDQILVIPTQSGWTIKGNQTVDQFRIAAQSEPLIVSVAGTTTSFNQGYSRYGFTIKGEQKSAYVYGVDPNYIPTMGIELIEGRNFDAAILSDSLGVIINEALARDMKWDNPLNEYLNWQEDSLGLGSKVIGVVKDYHFLSLEREVEPMFLSIDKEHVGYLTTLLVKVSGHDVTGGLEKTKAVWKTLFPDRPFEYSFLDDDVAAQYATYQRWLKIVGLATFFAIIISCLGLFGLAGINAVNRTKEIGIRKAMGAEIGGIFVLLNKQFLILAAFAYVIAIPASWYIMTHWWLTDFKFKVEIGWGLFAIIMAVGLMVALLTVTYHALKAANVNPAQTLKYE